MAPQNTSLYRAPSPLKIIKIKINKTEHTIILMWAIKAAAVVATCHDNQSENKYVTCHANSEIVNAAVQSACSQTRQSRTPAPMHMVVKRRNADEQEHSIFLFVCFRSSE